MLAHAPRNVGGNDVAVFQLHAKHGVGQGLQYRTFHLDDVVFGHGCLSDEDAESRHCAMLTRVVKDSSFRGGKIFIQLAPDFRLHRRFERGQQHAQASVDADVLAFGGDESVHAAACKMQRVAFPARGDVELLLQAAGDVLDDFAGAFGREGVAAGDVDLAHPFIVPAWRGDDNVLTGVVPQSAMFADVCIDGCSCSMRIEFASGTREPFSWPGGLLRIGSAETMGLRLDGAGVAAHHADLARDGRGIVLDVQRGAGRVHVNARPVRERALLRPGDILSIGGHRLRLCADVMAGDDENAGAGAEDVELADAGAVIALRAVAGPLSGRVWPLDGRMALDSRGPVDMPRDDALTLVVQGHRVWMHADAPGRADSVRVNGCVVRQADLADGDQLAFGAHRFVVDVSPAPEPVRPPPAPDETDAEPEPVQRGAPHREMGWLIVTAALLALVLAWVLLAHY